MARRARAQPPALVRLVVERLLIGLPAHALVRVHEVLPEHGRRVWHLVGDLEIASAGPMYSCWAARIASSTGRKSWTPPLTSPKNS
jgi:hypothetical protein